MFLDPEPRRPASREHSMLQRPRPISRPIEPAQDHRKYHRRKSQPLQERSPSQNNQQNPWISPAKPTVRLVKPSPPLSAPKITDSDEDYADEKENAEGDEAVLVVKPASASIPGFGVSSQDKNAQNVSDSNTSTNEAQDVSRSDGHSLLSAIPIQAVPRTDFHRRSGSTDNYSTSSTLRDSTFGQFSERSESRFSQGTTLRGTPTPYEQEHRERIEAEESARQASTANTLQTLQEASPGRSTVRVVAPTDDSESGDHHPPRSEPAEPSIIRPSTAPSSDTEQRPVIPQQSSRRTSSSSSLPAPFTVRKRSASSTPRNQNSQESFVQPERSVVPASSPNIVTFSSDPARPRSRSHPLHYSYSIESIESRLQYPTTHRPDTGRSIATSSSWASFNPSSSVDTLPPLQIPKKRVPRLRHKQGSLSLNVAANASYTSGRSMADEDFDTLPYPREHWSTHLSTIASESDRTTSQQLSHFSLGSGVLTGDDSSSIPLSGTWPRRRRESAPIDSMASESSRAALGTSSEEEAGDMTLGVFRTTSAKPEPLFKPRSGSAPGTERQYDGPLPPIPPIPKSRDSDENFDTVSELHQPRLREQRSGKSLRRRSNSTPSHSHSRHLSSISRSETDRWSQASSLFPSWAKQFYGQGAQLMSASKVSLHPPNTPRRDAQGHGRNDSQWTERSITSRLGTGYSEIESTSPTSSHFLPSIFRPRTRGRANTEGNSRSSRPNRSKKSRPSKDDQRTDSMAIFNDPLPESRNGENLPSGQPKFGELRDTSEQRRPLPRKYSKQRRWDEMEFPRPMTKDRLSDFGMNMTDPHLAPTKRNTYRLSAWRAPSFVESLDTLVRSQCNRQILLFAIGFVFPLLWMVAAVLPIPKKPVDYEKSLGGSEDDIQATMMKHEAGDAEKRWREEKAYMKARWWRYLNRIMSVIGVLVIGAVIALAIIATR